MPFVGMALGGVAILLVTLQLASEPEKPPSYVLLIDYGLLAFGVLAIGSSLVIYLRGRRRRASGAR
jgi:hypothetical protein